MTTPPTTHQSPFKRFTASALARPLVIVLVIGLIVAGNALVNHRKQAKYGDGRRAADTFLTAYTSCDLQTSKKYYLTFQTNSAAAASYQQQCHKGDISFHYDSPVSYTEKTVKGVRTINVTLLYSASQAGGKAAKFLVHMLWSSQLKQWTVTSIDASPTPTPTAGAKTPA